ncbi:MAG: DUF3619 family protein [Steroidobacteraceae bacterium]
MMTDDTEFEKRVRTLLEGSADRLDGRIRSRLTQARHAALDSQRHAAGIAWRSWAPAGALAASALLALLVFSNRGDLPPGSERGLVVTAESQTEPDDLDLLADGDADQLTGADDLDFYEWAASEDTAPGAGRGA